MPIIFDGTLGITSPGGDTSNTSHSTPIVRSPSALTLQTNGSTTAMTIDTSQNVGIGTTNPNTKIQAAVGSNGSGVVNALRLQNVGTTFGDGAKIVFTAGDSTDGAGIASTGIAGNSADLRFYSGGNTERMRIDSSGRITTPNQPTFHAIANGTGALTGRTARFPNALVNISSSYNTSTMSFTAPIAGTYYFYAAIMADTGTGRMTWQFYRNDSVINYNQGGGDSTNYGNWPGAMIITLSAGDYIKVNVGTGTPYNNTQEQYFGGYLLG